MVKTQKAGFKICRKYYLIYRNQRDKVWYKMDKHIRSTSISNKEFKKLTKKKWKSSSRSKHKTHRMMPKWIKDQLFENKRKDMRYLKTSGSYQNRCYYAIAIGDESIDDIKRELSPSILKKTKKSTPSRFRKRKTTLRFGANSVLTFKRNNNNNNN